MRRQVIVTRASKDGAARARAALEAGWKVMSKAAKGYWFEVAALRREIDPECGEIWHATPKGSRFGTSYPVRSFRWFEEQKLQVTRQPQPASETVDNN
jgi:hypothetical protein